MPLPAVVDADADLMLTPIAAAWDACLSRLMTSLFCRRLWRSVSGGSIGDLDGVLHSQTFLLPFFTSTPCFRRVIFHDVDQARLNDLDLLLLHLCEGMKLQMPSVGAVFSHLTNVLVERLIVNESSKLVRPRSKMVARLLPQLCVSCWWP